MSKENKNAGSPAKSMLFLLPLAVTAAAALIGIASLKPVPSELPEKLAYAESTKNPYAAPDHGAEATEAPSAKPIEAPQHETEPPTTNEPSVTAEAHSPNDSSAPETTPHPPSAEPTAAAVTATPKPTATPATAQTPENTNAPQHTGSPTNAPTNAPTSAPTVAPTAAPDPTAAPTAAPTEAPGRYKDGRYTSSARCETFNYDIEVTITIRGGDIKTVSVDYNSPENAPFMSMAINGTGGHGVPDQIVSNNGTEGVNVVSGATLSSNAIISASNSALARASKSVSGIIEPTVLPEKRFRRFEGLAQKSEER